METNVPNGKPDSKNTQLFTPGFMLPLLSLILIIICVIVYFVFNNHWVQISAYHLGALGITGLFAYLAAYIATRKGYNFQNVLLFTFFLPIVLGILAVIIVSFFTDFLYCGGGVVLAGSIVLVLIYSFLKKKS